MKRACTLALAGAGGKRRRVACAPLVRLIKNLSWIQEPHRVERPLHRAHEFVAVVAKLAFEKGLFGQAHAMLAGDRSA